MPVAAALDAVGIILIIFGLDDFWITDIIGLVFIGSWLFFHAQTRGETTPEIKTPPSELKEEIKESIGQRKAPKTGWIKRLRWLGPLLEFIPYVGAVPWWTITVYSQLKNED